MFGLASIFARLFADGCRNAARSVDVPPVIAANGKRYVRARRPFHAQKIRIFFAQLHNRRFNPHDRLRHVRLLDGIGDLGNVVAPTVIHFAQPN